MYYSKKLVTPEWDKKYEIDILEIDLQHKNFLKLIKKVELLEKGVIKKIDLSDILEEIILYARFHFRSEENLMKEFNYPEIESHKNQHKLLSDNLLHEVSHLMVNPMDISHLHNYLVNWLLEHILAEDKKLAGFLKNVS